METKDIITNRQGRKVEVIGIPIEKVLDFDGKKINDVRGYCFYKDKFVLVWSKDHWNIPGGSVEGETSYDAIIREIKEETNMKVIEQRLIFLCSYSFVDKHLDPNNKTSYQTVSVCFVKPYGDFHLDPDGDITKIKLIDPKDYKQYIDWLGNRGDELMKRALEILEQYISIIIYMLDKENIIVDVIVYKYEYV